MDPDVGPRQLMNKVMFDVRYNMCRRGGENYLKMTRDTFKLCYDQKTGIAFVRKIEDEHTKNHNDNDNMEIITGFMPQIVDSNGRPHKLCPVRSFENYINALNEKCTGLWQKDSPANFKKGQFPWYENLTIGKNPIATFMSKLSDKAGLSQIYTNHSICATGITNHTRYHYNPKQIMAITGHKSIQSLSVYQRVKSDEKMMMGMSLMYSLIHPNDINRVQQECSPHFDQPSLPNTEPEQVLQIQGTEQRMEKNNELQPIMYKSVEDIPEMSIAQAAIAPVVNENINPELAVIPFNANIQNENPNSENFSFLEFLNDDTDEDLILAANQVEQNINSISTESKSAKAASTKIIQKKSATNAQLQGTFSGCKIGSIGTINIHIHKS